MTILADPRPIVTHSHTEPEPTAEDKAWWAQESARFNDLEDMRAYYDSIRGRDYELGYLAVADRFIACPRGGAR